jgi:hypothetical protein
MHTHIFNAVGVLRKRALLSEKGRLRARLMYEIQNERRGKLRSCPLEGLAICYYLL